MRFLKSAFIIKKRLVFAFFAIALMGGGVASLFAQAPMEESFIGDAALTVAQVSDPFASAKQQVTPENLQLMLLRIGLLYGAFICVLGALETGKGTSTSDVRP